MCTLVPSYYLSAGTVNCEGLGLAWAITLMSRWDMKKDTVRCEKLFERRYIMMYLITCIID